MGFSKSFTIFLLSQNYPPSQSLAPAYVVSGRTRKTNRSYFSGEHPPASIHQRRRTPTRFRACKRLRKRLQLSFWVFGTENRFEKSAQIWL
ncbi:hypothetical protein LINPERPRIM_LOCUS7654 [Linum perenne]